MPGKDYQKLDVKVMSDLQSFKADGSSLNGFFKIQEKALLTQIPVAFKVTSFGASFPVLTDGICSLQVI